MGGPEAGEDVPRGGAGDLEEPMWLFRSGERFRAQGRIDQAIAHYERAISLKPDFVDAHNGLGMALAVRGRNDQAIAHFERALVLKPDYPLVHNNLGSALAMQGQMDQAIVHFERALALKPGDAQIHNNLGNAFRLQGRMGRAVSHHERALAIIPDYALAHHNLGSALMLQGRIDLAVAHHERAVSLSPHHADSHHSLLLTLNYSSNKESMAIYAAHLDFARRWEAPLARHIQPHRNDRSPERRLKIGYVSADFRQHSVSYFLEPVLSHHDHDRFEIFCYSNHDHEDEVTQRMRSHADHWHRIIGLSGEQLADQIRADKIDILVDLIGHFGANRLLVFARKPAPIQITWLGYPNTTGLSAMDYRLTDGFADPPGMTEHLHSERLVRLPECFSCYRPPADAPEISALPARERGYVTFGSFNNQAKITPEVMAVWAKILRSVPGSRLTLKNPAMGEDATQHMVQRVFREQGIAPERLELLGHDPSLGLHLERYWSIDIGLDPFPYNGATTTCEALWMGVPVVVLAGKTHAGRVGVSQLSNLGLTALIGRTTEEYITIALQLAADLDRLSALRAELRSCMAASPLTDALRFTRNLEFAYREMWKQWCHQNAQQDERMV